VRLQGAENDASPKPDRAIVETALPRSAFASGELKI
jgi:hypothetical protein